MIDFTLSDASDATPTAPEPSSATSRGDPLGGAAAPSGSFVQTTDDMFGMYDNLVRNNALDPVDPVEAHRRIEKMSMEQLKAFASGMYSVSTAAINALQSAMSPGLRSTTTGRLDPHGQSGAVFRTPGSLFLDAQPQLMRSVSGAQSSFTDSQQLMSNAHVVVTDHVERQVAPDGFKQINRYTVIDDLGHGAYGKVKLAIDESNNPVAIKIVRRTKVKLSENVNREIAVMKKLRHPNVVRLLEVIDDPTSEKLYMVMKYIEGGPIAKLRPEGTCACLDPDRVCHLAHQLLAGLSYLHKRHVAHRDIKPDNILVDSDGTPYFSDFGVSEILEGERHDVRTLQGTIAFMSPELLNEEGEIRADAFAADVWALGATLYVMLFGTLPFHGDTKKQMIAAIQHDELEFPPEASDDWKALLRGMLHKDPAKRWTIKQAKHSDALGIKVAVEVNAVTEDEVRLAKLEVHNFLADEEAMPEEKLLERRKQSQAVLNRYDTGVGSVVAGPRDVLAMVCARRQSAMVHLGSSLTGSPANSSLTSPGCGGTGTINPFLKKYPNSCSTEPEAEEESRRAAAEYVLSGDQERVLPHPPTSTSPASAPPRRQDNMR